MADINTPKAFLEEARQAVEQASLTKSCLNEINAKKDQLERNLSATERSMEKEKNDTLTKRRADVESGFQKQLKAIDAEIQNTTQQRQKARDQGVKERITSQTSEHRDRIDNLKTALKQTGKDYSVPFFCRNKVYYTLFCPSTFGEFFFDFLLAAVIIGGAFFLVTRVTKIQWITFALTGLIFIVVLVLYFVIYHTTKSKYGEGIRIACQMRKNIRKNHKEIHKITGKINRDKDDAAYDLHVYDDELAVKNQERERIEGELKDALYRFDQVTANVISDEIDARYRARIDELKGQVEDYRGQSAQATMEFKALESQLNGNYVQYLGTKNMSRDRINALLKIIENGGASSISDAIIKLDER